MAHLILGSSADRLAQARSHWVKAQLERLHPGLVVGVETCAASAESEQALLARHIDCAVQSLSDIPPFLPDQLHVAAVTERTDAREALVLSRVLPADDNGLFGLSAGGRVGVSNLCRAAQLYQHHPEWQSILLTGDSETCLAQLDNGACEAFLTALPELQQVDWAGRAVFPLDFAQMLPAAGQGASGLVTRIDDQRTNMLLDKLNHRPTRYATEGERSLLRHLGGGAHAPVAVLGSFILNERGQQLLLAGVIADVTNKRLCRREVSGAPLQYEVLGGLLAQQLIAAGAGEWLSKAAVLSMTELEELYPAHQPLLAAKEAALIATAAENVYEAAAAFSAPPLADAAPAPEAVAPPLANCRIIVTQTIWSSNELEQTLTATGAQLVACPVVEVREPPNWEQLDRVLLHLSWYDWVAFFSHHAADYFLRRFDELGHLRAELLARRILAVGRSTADRLQSDGVQPDLVLESLTEESFRAASQKRFGARRSAGRATMLLPSARGLGEILRPALAQLGVYVEIVEAYQTSFPPFAGREALELIQRAEADYLVFQGAATVAGIVSHCQPDTAPRLNERTRIVCLGETTAEEARALGLEIHLQPQDFSSAAVAELLADDWLKRQA